MNENDTIWRSYARHNAINYLNSHPNYKNRHNVFYMSPHINQCIPEEYKQHYFNPFKIQPEWPCNY